MQGKSSCLLALVLVCGVGRAGEPIPDDARFVGHLRRATVELLGVTYYRPNVKSRWWRPNGSSAEIGPYLRKEHKDRRRYYRLGHAGRKISPATQI